MNKFAFKFVIVLLFFTSSRAKDIDDAEHLCAMVNSGTNPFNGTDDDGFIAAYLYNSCYVRFRTVNQVSNLLATGNYAHVGLHKQNGQWHFVMDGDILVKPSVPLNALPWRNDFGNFADAAAISHSYGLGTIAPTETRSWLCQFESQRRQSFVLMASNAHTTDDLLISVAENVKTQFQCAVVCRAASVCHSFAYNRRFGRCRVQFYQKTESLMKNVGWQQFAAKK